MATPSGSSATRAGVFFSLVDDVLDRSGVDLVEMARQLERSGKREHNGLAARIEKLRTLVKSVGDDLLDQDQRLVEQARTLVEHNRRLLKREWANGIRKESEKKTWDVAKIILGALISALVGAAFATLALMR